jgi:S1-C subfamily serine protease
MIEQPGASTRCHDRETDVDTSEQHDAPITVTPSTEDWWSRPVAEQTPAPAPHGSSHPVRAAFVAAGVAGLVAVGVGHVLLGSQPALTSSLPTINSTGSAGQTSSGSSGDPGAAVSAAVVDINTTLGYGGGQAAATGIVLTSSGLVLTNNHVVNGATAIAATDVGNGQTYAATVVGYDVSHDVAVIKLTNASGLQTASIGDSSTLAVGDRVVGVGNAGGVGGEPSAATGTVTALDQSITASDAGDGTSEQLTGLIQVDAQIQPGDSGGPLVDTAGRVVGVDTAASAGTTFSAGGSEGFAIPIRTALGIAREIVSGTSSSAAVHIGGTGFLGVQVTGSPDLSGVEVAAVVAGSAAAQAGLSAGDLITAVDAHAVDSPDTLGSLLRADHPGDRVSVTWYDQQGQQHTATVELGSGPAA